MSSPVLVARQGEGSGKVSANSDKYWRTVSVTLPFTWEWPFRLAQLRDSYMSKPGREGLNRAFKRQTKDFSVLTRA
jgi:hypothetical protein